MRRTPTTPRFVEEEHGQSIVEMALMLPILVFLILAAGDMARGYAIQIAVQNGARAGAEAAAIDYTPTVTETEARTRDEMSRTPGMTSSAPSVSVTFKQVDGLTSCLNPPTLATPCFATVRVQYTWRTVTAWPLIPNTFNIDRQTRVRMLSAP